MRALHIGWFQHPLLAHPTGATRSARVTMALILAVVSGIAMFGGLAGLIMLDSLTGLLVGILVSDAASLGVAIVLGAVLLGLAAFTTIWWPVLRRREHMVALALAVIVWVAGMILMDPRLATLRASAAAWLANHSPPAMPGLIIMVVAATILATAYMLRSHRLAAKQPAPQSVPPTATPLASRSVRHRPAVVKAARPDAARDHASRKRPARTGHLSRPGESRSHR